MTDERASVDVNPVLDSARFLGPPLLVMLCAASITILDGFDIQIMGLASPALAQEWRIERSALAPAFAAALIGMAVGGFALGAVGDRWGRRPAMLLSLACFGVGTLVTAWVETVPMLVALRLITGVGLGGALPNATALMAEFAPQRIRGQAIAAAIIGVPIGGMLGATIAAAVVPDFGWRAMFLIGGALPLLAWLLLYFVLPESPQFLSRHPSRRSELAALLNRLVGERRFTDADRFSAPQLPGVQSVGLSAVLSRSLLFDTSALWIAFITNLFAVYCFYNWAPVVLTGVGLPLPTAVRGLLIFNTFGVAGALTASWLIARLGSRWVLAALCALGTLAMLYLWLLLFSSATKPTIAAIMGTLAAGGFCIIAVQVCLFAVAAHVYPTQCRAAGVGWAQGMGRLGGVLSAFAGSILAGSSFFAAIAATLAVTLLAMVALKRHLPAVAVR